MKTLKIFITFLLFEFLSPLMSFGQSEVQHGPDWLGVWCSIDVNLASDPTEGRYASYSFPHPPECLGPMQYNNGYPMYYDNTYFFCDGPGRPYITVNGGDPILHLDLKNLEIETELMAEQQGITQGYIETSIEFPVQKEITYLGTGPQQCYYSIRLVVMLNN